MRRRKSWAGRIVLCVGLAAALFIVFRQGWIPARYTPLPPLDLSSPFPILVDWQLAELKHDRRLCRQVISDSTHIKARATAPRAFRRGCGWSNAVRVSNVGGANIGIARVKCEVAAALALWVRHDVQPLARRILGQPVTTIQNFGTYSCRKMIGSRIWKSRMSEHATANAIDISRFRLANGTWISVAKHWKGHREKSQFLRAIHARACRYFRVSLSPDFNAAHHDHFHFDRGILSMCR
ncbi:MAG: extensin family protein [Hyphomicrobiales bacterium]|nr:extensin family protein [Hyphomicrobiales bacterium]